MVYDPVSVRVRSCPVLTEPRLITWWHGLGFPDELRQIWLVCLWFISKTVIICKLRNMMGSRNEPDETELWLLNDSTLEEIEEIANGDKDSPV